MYVVAAKLAATGRDNRRAISPELCMHIRRSPHIRCMTCITPSEWQSSPLRASRRVFVQSRALSRCLSLVWSHVGMARFIVLQNSCGSNMAAGTARDRTKLGQVDSARINARHFSSTRTAHATHTRLGRRATHGARITTKRNTSARRRQPRRRA